MTEEKNNTPRISIVIGTYIRFDKLEACLRSIAEYVKPSTCSVVVVANGAPNAAREVYENWRWSGESVLLWFDEPLGYPKANNHGIRYALEHGSDYIVLLNDDAEFLAQPHNQCIDVMLKPMLEDGAVGVTGPLQAFDENSGHEFLIFFCVMIRAKCFEEVGLLDESFLYFGEDTSFCIEAEKKGWKVVRVPEDHPTELKPIDPATTTVEAWKHDKIHTGEFAIWHDAESTIGRLPDSEDVLRASRARLQELYGAKEVNTPTELCERCGGQLIDNTCVGAENKLNCDGLYLWRAAQIDGWFSVCEMAALAKWVKNRGKEDAHA